MISTRTYFWSQREQNKRIEETVIGDSPLVIIDTDIFTTKSYSSYFLKKELEFSPMSKANPYLFLKNDVVFVQDGTSINKKGRDLLPDSHL